MTATRPSTTDARIAALRASDFAAVYLAWHIRHSNTAGRTLGAPAFHRSTSARCLEPPPKFVLTEAPQTICP